MPEATYIPLEGSGSRGYCWTGLSSLEKILIILSATLAVFVVALTIAIVSSKCPDNPPSNSTTTTTTTSSTTSSTTVQPNTTEVPASTTVSPETSTDSPKTSLTPNDTQLNKSTAKPFLLPVVPTIITTNDNVDAGTTEVPVKSETES